MPSLSFVPDIQTAGLEFSQVRVGRDFTVAAEPGERCFDVILAVSGRAHVADAYIDNVVGKSEFLQELFLVFQTEQMLLYGFFGHAEDDLLDLVELVDAENAA